MAGAKGSRGREISGQVRQGFIKALKNLKAGGTINDISDIWEEMIAQDPFKALDTLAKYIPKEHMIEVDHTHRLISGEPITIEQWEREHIEAPSPKLLGNGADEPDDRTH